MMDKWENPLNSCFFHLNTFVVQVTEINVHSAEIVHGAESGVNGDQGINESVVIG